MTRLSYKGYMWLKKERDIPLPQEAAIKLNQFLSDHKNKPAVSFDLYGTHLPLEDSDSLDPSYVLVTQCGSVHHLFNFELKVNSARTYRR